MSAILWMKLHYTRVDGRQAGTRKGQISAAANA
jgi:hypothetical protein